MTAAGNGRGDRLRVDIFAHAYVEPEYRKNIDALGRLADPRVILPARHANAARQPTTVVTESPRLRPARTWNPLGERYQAHYMLLERSLDLRERAPHILHVEYEPWTPLFWQVLAMRRRWAPHARVVSLVKKIPYRELPRPLGGLKRGLGLVGYDRIARVLATSRRAADVYGRLFGLAPDRIDVVTQLGVDTDLFAPAPERFPTGPLRVGYCGRLTAAKGVGDLVEAVATARARGTPLELAVLGRGPAREELAERARRDPWLSVHGAVPNERVPAFLRELDVFVMPTRVSELYEEHDAHAVQEAMACGLPCVATRSGILPEMLDDSFGVLVPAGRPGELAGALERLARDTDRRERLGRAARAAALDRYALAAVARQRLEVYERALA